MMKSPTAAAAMTTRPRMRSSMTMSPCGMRKRRAAGSPAPRRRCTSPGARPRQQPSYRGRAACGERRRAKLREALLRAEAVVGAPGGEQLVGGRPVPAEPLALPVRRARPAHVGPLVPLEAEPAQVGEDGVLVTVVRAHGVGVVDAQHEVAARVAREQEVEQGRARRADVQRARGARREPYSYPRLKTYGCSLTSSIPLQNRLQSIIWPRTAPGGPALSAHARLRGRPCGPVC